LTKLTALAREEFGRNRQGPAGKSQNSHCNARVRVHAGERTCARVRTRGDRKRMRFGEMGNAGAALLDSEQLYNLFGYL
jgi:hypothetical protein